MPLPYQFEMAYANVSSLSIRTSGRFKQNIL